MSNDDSFSDCDEVFSLYSSKKVTDTFKAQLKKIAANKQHVTNSCSDVNNDELDSKKDEKLEIPSVKKQKEPSPDCIEILGDLTEPIEINNSLEDSLEVINEFIPRRVTRQSTRLTRGRGRNCGAITNLTVPTNNNVNQGRKRGKNRKKQLKGKAVEEVTLDDSPQPSEIDDELNPEFSVKVIWKSVNVKKFLIRKFQKLSYIFEQLSKEENIPEDKVILMFNNVRVNQNDTPDSLNLQVYHFLDGGVLSELSSNLCQTPESHKLDANDDTVTLKFQDVNRKIIKLSLHKNEKLKVAMIKCSEQLEIPLSKIRFFFDGELLNPSETPTTLGLENEEVLDIKISD